uniref:Uncharacterized protein n=1 Tax=Vespula pensylvanica TaxID=30213 RepID=A0A834JFM5_VESPE|nr:hypothetical protein H0235_018298 [Vespula pensylvanica]
MVREPTTEESFSRRESNAAGALDPTGPVLPGFPRSSSLRDSQEWPQDSHWSPVTGHRSVRRRREDRTSPQGETFTPHRKANSPALTATFHRIIYHRRNEHESSHASVVDDDLIPRESRDIDMLFEHSLPEVADARSGTVRGRLVAGSWPVPSSLGGRIEAAAAISFTARIRRVGTDEIGCLYKNSLSPPPPPPPPSLDPPHPHSALRR